MQYYTFKEACDTKETGSVYPQIQDWKRGYDEDKPDSYYSYYDASVDGNFPEFAPDLDSMLMHGRARLTDLISSPILIGFIISKKLKTLFDQFVLPPHRFYPAKILHKKEELNDYFFMHIISDYTDFVDYPKSTFITYGHFSTNPEPLFLTTKQEYIDKSQELREDFHLKKKTYRAIYAKETYLNSKFDQNLDLFRIGTFDINFYISENLRAAIAKNEITGCDIQPTSKISICSPINIE